MNNKKFAITAISTLILLLSCSGDEIIVNSDNNPNQISDIKPILKVYIENSGSMDGYMCDGSQLKDAIFDYVSDLSTCVDTIIATEREYSHFINITIPKGVNIAEDYLILKAPNMPSWVL